MIDAPAAQAADVARRDRATARPISARTPCPTAAAAGRVPCRREHLSLDVPDARRARACWSARSDSPRCCCATCSSGGASSRCCAPSATAARHLFAIILSENAVLLGWGLAVGAVSALVAIAPAAIERGARLPLDGRRLAAAPCRARSGAGIVRHRHAGRAARAARRRAESRVDYGDGSAQVRVRSHRLLCESS